MAMNFGGKPASYLIGVGLCMQVTLNLMFISIVCTTRITTNECKWVEFTVIASSFEFLGTITIRG